MQKRVEELEKRVEEADPTVPANLPQMRHQVGIGKAAGAFCDEPGGVGKCAKHVEGATEEDQAVGEELAEVEAELQRLVEEPARALWHAAEQMDARRKLLKDKYQDEFLGPQWTEKTEARYKVHCERRREANLKAPTRRRFLKYKVEKRLRRRAKWTEWRIHGAVEREQNRALPEMVPVGVSLVFCSRLTFHEFKLSKRIMKYFSYLALARFHDRMRTW